MPEPGQAPGTGTDPTNLAGSGNPPNVVPPAGATPPAGSGSGQDPEREKHESELRRARDEAAASRVKNNELAAELKKFKDAQLSDTERQANRIKELEVEAEKSKAALFQKDVQVALAVAGAKKPELVAKLVPSDATDVNKAVEALKKEMPELFAGTPARPGGADAGAGNGAGADAGLGGMNAVIRRMAGR